MRGQIWSELLLAFSIIFVFALAFTTALLLPFMRSVHASVAYTAAVDEVVRQEVEDLKDYAITEFNSDPGFTQITVDGVYRDGPAIESAVRYVLDRLSPSTTVVVR